MTKKNDNHLKAVIITAMWIVITLFSLEFGFLPLGVGLLAMLATDAIVGA